MDLAFFELLCTLPQSTPPSPAQLEAVKVAADGWAQEGHPQGLALAEHLQGHPLTAERWPELHLEPWMLGADVRTLALTLFPGLPSVVERLAARADFEASVRALAWLGTDVAGLPLHALVAEQLFAMLSAVERRELSVTRESGFYRLQNGWRLDVFVRVYSFWRIDAVTSPDGFTLDLLSFDAGPLAVLNEYEPPTDEIEAEVYGLGLAGHR